MDSEKAQATGNGLRLIIVHAGGEWGFVENPFVILNQNKDLEIIMMK